MLISQKCHKFYAYRKNFLFKKSKNLNTSKYSSRRVEQVTLYVHFSLILTNPGFKYCRIIFSPKRMNQNLIFYHVNSKLMVINKVGGGGGSFTRNFCHYYFYFFYFIKRFLSLLFLLFCVYLLFLKIDFIHFYGNNISWYLLDYFDILLLSIIYVRGCFKKLVYFRSHG